MLKKIIKNIFYIFSILILFNLLFFSKNTYAENLTKNFFALDTIISINFYDYENKNDAVNCLDETKDLLMKYEKIFSPTSTTSELYRLNKNELKFEDASEDLQYIINLADEISTFSNCKYDIHTRKLIELWDIKNRKSLPSEKEILDAKNDKTEIDLGSIAKGYIADRLKYFYKDYGIKSGIINLGGNIVCIGSKQGRDFNIGIKYPFKEDQIIETVQVRNKAVVTSGIYERYFKIQNDKRIYNHIIDPTTGYPINDDLYSVTVITEDSTLADALSTACMVLGFDKATLLLNKIENEYDIDIQAVFIDKNLKRINYNL